MESFTVISSHLVALPSRNIDTDQIIPARFLKVTSRRGLASYLFYDWRHDADGARKQDNVLNKPVGETAKILLAGDNFGCGSSREHAAWALQDYGFRVVISTSFANIFRDNALKNALLPIVVQPGTHTRLLSEAQTSSGAALTVDLVREVLVLPDGTTVSFPIDGFSRNCLLSGVDELGYILRQDAEIVAWEAEHGGAQHSRAKL